MIKYVLNFRSPPIFSSSSQTKGSFHIIGQCIDYRWLYEGYNQWLFILKIGSNKQPEWKISTVFFLIWNNFVVGRLVLSLVLFRFHSSNEISLKSTFYAGERTDLSKLYKKLLAPPSCQKSNMSKWFGSGNSLQIKFLYWRITEVYFFRLF